MADNTELLPGGGGDTLRDVQKGGVAGPKTQIVVIDMGGGGVEDITSLPASQLKQDTGNTSVASIDAKTPALGQALAAASVPIVLTAIQQAALTPPAAISGFALEAGHLAAIDTSVAKIPGQGQALAAASMPVVLTAIQQAALTPPAAITNFALETGGNLATITSRIPALGQAAMAASSPVVIASDQPAIPITGSISATSAATASSTLPSNSEGVSSALSQTLDGGLRTSDRGFNYEKISETNDLLRILIREIQCLRMGFSTELRDMPEPESLDNYNADQFIN